MFNKSSVMDHRVQADMVALLYRELRTGLLTSLVLGIIAAVVLARSVPVFAVACWFTLLSCSLLARYVLLQAYERRLGASPADDETGWEQRFVWRVGFSGLVWGGGVWLVDLASPGAKEIQLAFYTFLLAGMTGGAIGALAPSLQAYRAFLLATALLLAFYMVLQGTWIHSAMATMILVYIAAMNRMSRYVHDSLLQSFSLRYLSDDLARDLSRTMELMSERTAELDDSHELFQKLSSQVPGGIYQFRLAPDGGSSLPFVSGAIRQLFELEPEQVKDSAEDVFSRIHPEDIDHFIASIQESARTLAPWHEEFRVVLPQQGLRWREGKSVPERLPDGSTLWHGFITDVTERKLLDQQLIEARDRAESANRAKSEFLASMSHELRTPLNAVLGFAQLIESDDELQGDAGEFARDGARQIHKAGKHLLALVDDVLDLARIEAGRMEISLCAVSLPDLFAGCEMVTSAMGRERGISLVFDHDSCAGLHVRADQVRIKQVLLNLVSNAIKYNRPSGSVRVFCRQTASHNVRILVEDTGIGIAEDKRSRLFTLFERLGAENSAVEGTGIGLVITRRLMELMGGAVGFESVAGQGSTFWVEFQRDEAPGEGRPPGAESPGPARPGDVEKKLVLYIEDNAVSLRLMQHALGKRRDLRLVGASSAEEGLPLAQRLRPDLILLDINLPGMDGYAALVELRAMEELESTPVIALTANAMKGDIEQGLAVGFSAYITKPVDIPRLCKTLDQFLGEARPVA